MIKQREFSLYYYLACTPPSRYPIGRVMSVIQLNLFTVSNYTLLRGKSPFISQNFMNSNDNTTNRQGYDFYHDTAVILVL